MRSTPASAIIGILTVYAMADIALMPAAQTIFRSISSIRGHASVVNELLPDVLAGRAIPQAGRRRKAHDFRRDDIRFDRVSYRYPEAATTAVSGASFAYLTAITALVGRSGAGRVPLADLLLGLLRPPEAASWSVPGISRRPGAWRAAMGYVPQSIFLLDDTITANVAFEAL